MDNKVVNKIVKFTENIVSGKNFSENEILLTLKLAEQSACNLGVYKGILIIYYFFKFRDLPDKKFERLKTDESFTKCISLLDGDVLSPLEVGGVLFNILTIPDNDGEYRDILTGCFYGALWPFMNNPQNFDVAVDYGIEIIKSAFSLDNFNIEKKLSFAKNKAKVISLAGSGKKEIKLLNISSMAAIITAAVGKAIGENIVVEKTISRATSSVTGSSDIFEFLGVNLDMSIHKMADISLRTRLGVFDINAIVPKLNHVYDGRLYNIQIFAGLVGGAAIVNPVDVDLINYGLTRGSAKLCLAILSKLYPGKNILVLQGKDPIGKSVIDQVSVAADTEIAQMIQGQDNFSKVTPKNFGFDFKPFKYIETTQNSKENLKEFIKLLAGQGNKELKQAVAMEVALNLFGFEVVDDFKKGADLALETINSGIGIRVLEDLVVYSNGNKSKFNNILVNI